MLGCAPWECDNISRVKSCRDPLLVFSAAWTVRIFRANDQFCRNIFGRSKHRRVWEAAKFDLGEHNLSDGGLIDSIVNLDLSPGERWYLAHTLPNKEAIAAMRLDAQGFRNFLPRSVKTVRHARRMRQINSPVFPVTFLLCSISTAISGEALTERSAFPVCSWRKIGRCPCRSASSKR